MTDKDPTAMFRLDGRTAVITGVGPGIGAHVSTAYARAGANVVLAARNTDRIEGLAKELRDEGCNAMAVRADVGQEEDLRRLVAEAEKAFGAVDIVFNNAHLNPAWSAQKAGEHGHAKNAAPDKGPLDYTTEDWESALAVNVMAPYRLTQMVAPGMKERGRGTIITVLSGAAFRPSMNTMAYGVTKSGLHMLTRYLAKALGPEIRVNAICPATISLDGEVWEGFRHHIPLIPLGRPGLASELVGAALFLASDASSYSSGQVVFVDGGRINTA